MLRRSAGAGIVAKLIGEGCEMLIWASILPSPPLPPLPFPTPLRATPASSAAAAAAAAVFF